MTCARVRVRVRVRFRVRVRVFRVHLAGLLLCAQP